MAHTKRQGKSSHVIGAWLGQTYLLVLASLLERREAVTHPGNIQFQESSGGHIDSLASTLHLGPAPQPVVHRSVVGCLKSHN